MLPPLRPLLLSCAMLALPALAPGASADPLGDHGGCDVDLFRPTCSFECQPLDILYVSAQSFLHSFVAIRGECCPDPTTCGGSAVACAGIEFCSAEKETLIGGTGTCTLLDGELGSCVTRPLISGCQGWFAVHAGAGPLYAGTYYVTTGGHLYRESNGRADLQCYSGCDRDGCYVRDQRIFPAPMPDGK